MPTLIAAAVLPLIVNSPIFFLGPAAVSAVATGVGYAAVAGATLLAQRLTAKEQPKPEDVQNNFRQAVSPRIALYGQGKIGGPWVFAETKEGSFYRVFALSSRQLASIEEYWVDDRAVELDGSGEVQTPEELEDTIQIQTRLGLPTETAYSALTALFPEWTSSHRGDGIASLYACMEGVAAEDISTVYPSGYNTQFRVVARGVAVFDPRELAHDVDDADTWEYSDNLALVILDYLRHADGMRMPVSLLTTPQALAGWTAAADDCDDLIPLKAGGTEPRYRLWGAYRFDERPGDVLRRFMAAGNARFLPTSDGGMTIEVGKWREPTVSIDETMIVGFEGVGRGKAIMETANSITAQYTSPLHDYQAIDADPWIDDADVAERGEITASAEFICAPTHSQCRRLMKIEAHRANPEWVGTFVCNLKALPAFGERFIHLEYEAFGIDDDFEVLDFQFVFGEHSTLKGVVLQVQSISSAAFAWNAATEEGTAPPVESTEDDHAVPVVANFVAAVFTKTVSSVLVPFASLSWNEPSSESLTVELRGKRTADTLWQSIGVSPGENQAESFVLSDGEQYEFQARFRTATARVGSWTVSSVVTASLWTPLELGASLVEWWDASSGVTQSAGSVSAWAGRKSGYSASQATVGSRPVYSATGFNGVPGITFDGTDDCLEIAATPAAFPIGSNPVEIWSVVQQTAAAADTTVRQIFAYGDAVVDRRYSGRFVSSGVNRARSAVGNGTTGLAADDAATAFSTRHVVRSVIGSTSTSIQIDGGTITSTAAVPATVAGRTRIGASNIAPAGNFWNGKIRDVVVTSQLTTGQASSLAIFLMTRRAL